MKSSAGDQEQVLPVQSNNHNMKTWLNMAEVFAVTAHLWKNSPL